MFLFDKLKLQLKEEEDLRLKVYDDATGKPLVKGMTLMGHPTIGIGRNLAGRGITEAEAFFLLANDIDDVYKSLIAIFPWFEALDDVRQRVLIDMAFNMGMEGFTGFRNTLRLVKLGHYEDAASNMLESKWAEQVGRRALRLARMMRDGKDHPLNEDKI